MTINSSGDIWVADTYNDRIEEFNAEGSYVRQFGTEGEEDGQFKNPAGVAVDSKDDLYVSDTGNNRIEEFTEEGIFVRAFGSSGSGEGQLELPEGLTVNSKGDVLVADRGNNRVEEFTEEGEYMHTLGSEGSGDGQLLAPGDVATDSTGDVIVADTANSRVEEFNKEGEYIRQFGSNGNGDGQFEEALRLSVGPDNEVLVADSGNHRVQVFSLSGEYLYRFGTEGSGEGEMLEPFGVATYGMNAYVIDAQNERVEIWATPSTPSNISAPSITGGTVVGDTLSATSGNWAGKPPLTYSYQWQTCNEGGSECSDIEGATTSSYTLTESYIGKRLQVEVTATGTLGAATVSSPSSAIITAATAPSNTSAPVIAGTAKDRQALNTSTGAWEGEPSPTYTYQWQKCNSSGGSCSNISGATYFAYAVNDEDVGSTLKVVVKATNSAGSASSTSTATEVIAPLIRTTKYTYDANGNIETITDPYGKTTTYTYDADNEPTKTEQPNGAITETEYDANGQVISQTSGDGQATKYERNLLGEVTEIIDPKDRKTTKEYDPVGNPTKIIDPESRTTTYTYNADNQPTKIHYSEEGAPEVKYEYDADGNRTKMTDGTGTTTYTYDQLDRLTKTKDGHGDTVSYEYNLDNEPTKITYPNGKSIERTYDKDGRLHTATDWLEHTTTFSYDPDSNLSATTFPSASGEEDTYAYDDADQMSEAKMKKGEEVLASLVYTRNDNEQVTRTESKGLPGEEETNETYDANNRLTKAGATNYKYDPANNPTQTGSNTNSYDEADELENGTGISYTYNKMGERTKTTPTSDPATTYGYDQAGNLTTVERPKESEIPQIEDTYGYNGDGLQTSQIISGATSYLTWDTAEELPLILNDETNNYIYGPGNQPIEQINNTTGAVTYLHHDQAGSTRLLTGSTGTVTGKCTYAAYGTPTCEGSATTPLGYDGQYTSSDTGLIYLRNRVYDPSTAQFLSVDPLVKLTGAPYNYAGDNPVNEGDPTGLLGWSEIGQAVGVGLVCVATDGAGCVAAGLADLDANVVSNDYEAVAESCRAGEEESSSLTDLAGFALGAGVGGLADGSLSEEAKKALESTSAGQAALKQLVGLGAGSSALTTLAYAQGHESSGSSCSCGG